MKRKLLQALVGGMIGAGHLAAYDLRSWAKSGGSFDWSLAVRRWLGGFMVGAMSALGVGATV